MFATRAGSEAGRESVIFIKIKNKEGKIRGERRVGRGKKWIYQGRERKRRREEDLEDASRDRRALHFA